MREKWQERQRRASNATKKLITYNSIIHVIVKQLKNKTGGKQTIMGVSIRPSTFVEGGAVPVDQDLSWKNPHFTEWDYNGKAAKPTTALLITLVTESGEEHDQYYSVGSTERFTASEDGKTLDPVVEGTALSKSSNFYILMNALINAGFPENRLPENGDVSGLDGLVAHHIGMPEPKRSGLVREAPAEGAKDYGPRVISVPDRIVRLPGEKKGSKVAPKVAGKASADVTDKTIAFVNKVLDGADDGTIERRQLATRLFKDLARDPDKDAIAKFIFAPDFAVALLANGLMLDGEVIGKPA